MRKTVERLKWRIADLLNTRRQCWADLVSWVLDEEPLRDTGLRAALPWRPITALCRKDAASNGRCYCGKLAADGTVLRRGETVCSAPAPTGPYVCLKPDGHDGYHAQGTFLWDRATAERCPAATGAIPISSIACQRSADGAHRCRLDARHVHHREHRPDGVDLGDHHCACGHVWSTAPSVGERAAELTAREQADG